jgi:3-oxoacyl-[acyl-carrier-protein] synthase-3
MVDTNDQWIVERTGIKSRHIAGPTETSASLGAQAALNALKMANLSPNEIDLIICATSTPEYIFPSTASLIQDRIGANKAGAFDLSAACTGFIYAINMASQSIISGAIKTAIVIGTETLSRVTNWEDRGTCILFGDGAGAFILQSSDQPGGVISSVMRSDGSGAELLSLPAGGSAIPTSTETIAQGLHYIQMNGREVFRFATRVMARASKEAVQKANLDIEDIKLIVPHQANLRIIESAARGLRLPIEKFEINLSKYGNTSTASIPIAAFEAAQEGRLQFGDKIVLVGFGAGLTWGAAVVIWTGPFPTQLSPPFKRLQIFALVRSFIKRLIRRIEGIIWGRKTPH